MKNILFITNLSTPYRIDFFNELGKISNLTVIFEFRRAKEFTFNWNDDSISNFKAIFLNEGFLSAKKLNFSLLKFLKKDAYDAIFIGCYFTWTETLAILYMKLFSIPYFFETDGGMIPARENWIKRKMKTFLISGASKYFSPSKGSDAYLKYYGAENICRFPFTSLSINDIKEKPTSKDERKQLKMQLGVQQETMVLAIGQFIHRKGFDILLRSCVTLRDKNVGVYIIGGMVTDEYLSIINELNLRNIYFEGFKTKKEIEQRLNASDLFVLPTREDIWGLVINEAMACGLPVITTNRCVAGVELITDKECILPVEDVDALSKIMNKIICDDEYANRLSTNNLISISENTFENMAIAHINNIR